jgi:hypothetical protein
MIMIMSVIVNVKMIREMVLIVGRSTQDIGQWHVLC